MSSRFRISLLEDGVQINNNNKRKEKFTWTDHDLVNNAKWKCLHYLQH